MLGKSKILKNIHYGYKPKEEVKMTSFEMLAELSTIQAVFTRELIELAKKYDEDANKLMQSAIFSFNRTAKQIDLNKQ